MHGIAQAPQSIPFFGLGFDLSEVQTRAGAMRLQRAGHDPLAVRPRSHAPAARLSGYGLLLSLSREIRGR